MATPTTVLTPDFTGTINQQFFVGPLGGAKNPINYLDRFPETVYNKSIDSHLVRFMYALLGPAGVGWLRQNYLQARLQLEDFGLSTFDLDDFYGDPLRFGRILEEIYVDDPSGLLTRDQWQRIQTQDAAYRSRALDYVAGARAGNTPLGMHLVARSGLGHEVEIIENYKSLYDNNTDDPIGLPYVGVTRSTEEMIVIPRRDAPQSEIQVITFTGGPTGGTFKLNFDGQLTGSIPYNATNDVITLILQNLAGIGANNCEIEGGPLPGKPIRVRYINALSMKDVPQLRSVNELTGGTFPAISITTEQNGVSGAQDVASIAPRDQQSASVAIGYIKPVTAIVTFGQAPGTRINIPTNSSFSSSENTSVVRYVTGQNGVAWPSTDATHWIERSIEKQSLRIQDDQPHHYQGFHNVGSILAYTEEALVDPDYADDNWLNIWNQYKSEHIGAFTQFQQILYAPLNYPFDSQLQFTSDRALADYTEPLTIQASGGLDGEIQLVNGIYPTDYQSLAGVPQIKYKDDQFWASLERPAGTEFLEIDLGEIQAVNFISFETTRKPVTIGLNYDILGISPSRNFQSPTLDLDIPSVTRVEFDPASLNPWTSVELHFFGQNGNMIFTRYLRLAFTRRPDLNSPFQTNTAAIPSSVEVRNLRVGRNVT